MQNKFANKTKNLFEGLQVGKTNTDLNSQENSNVIEDEESIDIESEVEIEEDNNSEDNIFSSLLENKNKKVELIRATHYLREDQINDIAKFAKKSKKGKNEFLREALDLIFTELKKAQK